MGDPLRMLRARQTIILLRGCRCCRLQGWKLVYVASLSSCWRVLFVSIFFSPLFFVIVSFLSLFFYLIMHYRYLPSSLTHTHNCLYLFPLGNHVSLLSLLSLLFLSLSLALPLSPFPQTLEATHLVVVNLHAIHGGLMQLAVRGPLARTRKVRASLI